jgi:hypothetical protein
MRSTTYAAILLFALILLQANAQESAPAAQAPEASAAQAAKPATTVTGGAQIIVYKPLTASETIGAPSLDEVPVGAIVLYILRQPAGYAFAIAWASPFKGNVGSAARSNTYSTFRFYRVSEAELLLIDIPLLGEDAGGA